MNHNERNNGSNGHEPRSPLPPDEEKKQEDRRIDLKPYLEGEWSRFVIFFLVFFGGPCLGLVVYSFFTPNAVLPTSLVLAGIYVAVTVIAPFFPQWQFFLPQICKLPKGVEGICLTFDDGPDPEMTPQVLSLLKEYKYPATFFIIGKKAEEYPEIVQRIRAEGHCLGNHTYSHDTLIALKWSKDLEREIRMGHEVLSRFVSWPLLFRPPVGVTNPHFWPILQRLGLVTIGFSRRGMDWGNRRVHGLGQRVLRRVRNRDIILLHDCAAPTEKASEQFLTELRILFQGLKDQGIPVVPLMNHVKRNDEVRSEKFNLKLSEEEAEVAVKRE